MARNRATAPHPTCGHLPQPPTSLIGREAEAAAVVAALLSPTVRLLTLIGPGGVGKTRLALRASELAAAEGLAACFVSLAAVSDPDLFAPTIAGALGVAATGDQPIAEGIADAIDDEPLLLVLDNLEHLPPAAGVVADLLSACPELRVLATSRTPLRLAAERRIPVPPLPLSPPTASPDDLAGNAAVRLFVERARAAGADSAVLASNLPAVAAVCARLDGLPLAIELAAAQAAVLAPPALLARLDPALPLLGDGPRDAPARHRTMRDAIAWSYDLLAPAEQALFRRLAVFAGGFALDAAEAVGNSAPSIAGPLDPAAPRLLDSLAALVSASLVRPAPASADGPAPATPRFAMLETVREFALERLVEAGEDGPARTRHAAWFAAWLAATPRAHRLSIGWATAIDAERDNLRAAMTWAVAAGDAESGLALATALFGNWMLRGHAGEGLAWIARLLPLLDDAPPAARGFLVHARGSLRWTAGDLAGAEADAWAVADLAATAGDPVASGMAWLLLGLASESGGDLPSAAERLERALAHGRAAGAAHVEAAIGGHLGRVRRRLGDSSSAQALLLDAVALGRAHGEAWGTATALADLGLAAADAGETAAAAGFLVQSLDLHAELGDRLAIAYALAAAARLLAEAGEPVAAVRCAAAVEATPRQAVPAVWAIARPEHERAVALAREALDARDFLAAWDAGRLLATGEAAAAARAALLVLAEDGRASPLSPRELDVLRLVAAGLTDRETADRLGIGLRTVHSHILRARAKLGAASRAAAVAEATRRGLL